MAGGAFGFEGVIFFFALLDYVFLVTLLTLLAPANPEPF
jgi:hypothetical protein